MEAQNISEKSNLMVAFFAYVLLFSAMNAVITKETIIIAAIAMI
ncbi:hypothetical protein [Paenibacillus albicereus]|nr:hypothetical protein [Paenibacillus albicereus]